VNSFLTSRSAASGTHRTPNSADHQEHALASPVKESGDEKLFGKLMSNSVFLVGFFFEENRIENCDA